MNIGIVGSGPAAEAVNAACSDVDVTPRSVAPDELADVTLGVVIGPAGADAFTVANRHIDRWIGVEIGGLGGQPLAELDAGVTVYAPGSGCYECLAKRVASNIDPEQRVDTPSGDRSVVRLAGAVAGRRAVAVLSGAEVGGTVVELPWRERSFLPTPGCDCGPERERTLSLSHRTVELDDALKRAQRALDERVGLLREVGEQESFPVPYYVAVTADTRPFSDVRAAEHAAGVAADWNPAFMKALGEGLERYCAGVYRAVEFTTAPERTRSRPVSPTQFVRPTDAGPDVDTPLPWVDGIDLETRKRVSLPAEFVHYPPPASEYGSAITTGLGLGNSGVEAVLSGLYEVIERDATMLAWYSTFEPLELAVDDESFEHLVGRARSESLSVTPLLVTQDVDVPVVAVAVHRDERWPKFAVGSAANLNPARAARGALAEALQNWTELRSMGPDAASEEGGAIGAYADFPAEARAFVDADTMVPADTVGPDPVPTGEDELSAVVDRVSDAGLDAFAARLTTRDVAELGFEAVRALVPAAQPLFTGAPYFGDRARRVPRELGYEPDLDRAYHPYP